MDTFGVSNDNLPVGTIPLFATSSPEYKSSLSKVIVSANHVYQDFLKSPEGIGFCGQICLVGDSVGAILAYDALCIENTLKRSSSDTSVGGAATTCRITYYRMCHSSRECPVYWCCSRPVCPDSTGPGVGGTCSNPRQYPSKDEARGEGAYWPLPPRG